VHDVVIWQPKTHAHKTTKKASNDQLIGQNVLVYKRYSNAKKEEKEQNNYLYDPNHQISEWHINTPDLSNHLILKANS